MDVHRLLSVLIATGGAVVALAGVCIAGLGLRVKIRVAASRTRDAGLDV